MIDKTMYVSDSIKWIGVNDRAIDLFEGQYVVPNGMAYNSYVIIDEKIAVMDTVDQNFTEEWLKNLDDALSGRMPDYLVVQHMEPDHSANVAVFMEKYPEAVVVASMGAFSMMKNFFGTDFAPRKMVVKEGSELNLGGRTLTFVTAPMVHWPEVIVTYDSKDKVLFSADGFGKFGTVDADEDWDCEARRYYIGIVGKFGTQVQALLKKASCLEINKICPLHGPVLCDDLGHYINKYDIWSSYRVEDEGVTIAYSSVYGHTKTVALKLAEALEKSGTKVEAFDLARDDQAEAVECAFRYSKLVLATTTYNGSIFPVMNTFIHALKEHNFQNRKVAFIENGTWAPVAMKVMKELLADCKNLTFADNNVTVKGALNESSEAQLMALAEEFKA